MSAAAAAVQRAVTRPGIAPLWVRRGKHTAGDSYSSQIRPESKKPPIGQEQIILRFSSSYPGTILVERINHLASSIDATINYLFEILLFAVVRV